MVFLPPIPPKPPLHSKPTVIASRTTAVPNTTDTPATEKRKNKSYDNIENDRPDDDYNNNNNDVDCFPRQDKQPVLPQDISPNNNTLPSLIETNTDKSTNPTDTDNNNNNVLKT